MCRCFPGAWQVHFIWPNSRGALLTGIEKERPGYERLLSVLQSVPGSKASRSWVDRVNPFRRVSCGTRDMGRYEVSVLSNPQQTLQLLLRGCCAET